MLYKFKLYTCSTISEITADTTHYNTYNILDKHVIQLGLDKTNTCDAILPFDNQKKIQMETLTSYTLTNSNLKIQWTASMKNSAATETRRNSSYIIYLYIYKRVHVNTYN